MAVVRKLADSVQDRVHKLLANGIVATSIVVGGIFLARNQLLYIELAHPACMVGVFFLRTRMEQLTVSARTHLVYDGGLQVGKHRTRYMLPGTCLAKERLERMVRKVLSFGDASIRLDPVLQTVLNHNSQS